MALASAMIATIVECQGIAVEYYSPNETRFAAVGRTTNVTKDEVIAAMQAKHSSVKVRTEHEADALATFEAAKAGNLVRITD